MDAKGVLLGVFFTVAGSWVLCPNSPAQFTQGPPDNPSAAGIISGNPAPTPILPHLVSPPPVTRPPSAGIAGPSRGEGIGLPTGEEMIMSPHWLLSAQGMPALIDGPSVNMLADYLNLSPQQTERVGSLRDRFYRDTRNLRYSLLQRRIELRQLFADPATDRSILVRKQRESSSLWQKLMDALADSAIEGRQILTPEQIEKLERLPGS